MSAALCARRNLLAVGVMVCGLAQGEAQIFSRQATEFYLTPPMAGDQVKPKLQVGPDGGYLVWQDNAADEHGFGITAMRIDRTFSGTAPFRVNQRGEHDQVNPHVALLAYGQALFVWQGGPPGQQNIYARFLNADGQFQTGDILVNSTRDRSTYSYVTNLTTISRNKARAKNVRIQASVTQTNLNHLDPVAAGLSDGSAVVVYGSYRTLIVKQKELATNIVFRSTHFVTNTYWTQVTRFEESMQDLVGQRIVNGRKSGEEFFITDTRDYNQRSPAMAGLPNGQFVVAWVSEHQRFENSVDVYARVFDAKAKPLTGEILVNTGTNITANPAVIATSGGGFLVAWSQHVGMSELVRVIQTEQGSVTNRTIIPNWEVFSRPFSSGAQALSEPAQVNQYSLGGQYAPQLAQSGGQILVAWTSALQDGSREGIYGRFLNSSGSPAGNEFRVNSTTPSQQLHPAVGSSGNRMLVAWSSYVGGTESFELLGQRFSTDQSLPVMEAPQLDALDSYRLAASWAPLPGFSVARYHIYLDQQTEPVVTANRHHVWSGLNPGSAHAVRVAYELEDGRISAPSLPAYGSTWGRDENLDGLPDDWQQLYWTGSFPSPDLDSDGDGATNRQEFLAGTDPRDPASVLRAELVPVAGGIELRWQTRPGFVYEVQSSPDMQTWSPVGEPRYASGSSDAVAVSETLPALFYRVVRQR